MRIRTLTVIALTGLGLSGCSLWSKSDKADMATQSDASLRSTPQQDYQFLYNAGVKAIFGPGTNIPDAARDILKLIGSTD